MSSISRSLQTSAAGVGASTASGLGAGPGASPRAALHDLQIRPIPHRLAKQLLVREHYLHSMPGGTMLSFGAFHGTRLVGALTLGVGPKEGHRLISNSRNEDCATLTRFWMDDAMPANCESRVLGIVLRSLRRHTGLKFILSYADPSQGHIGTIYQAAGWIYTGLFISREPLRYRRRCSPPFQEPWPCLRLPLGQAFRRPWDRRYGPASNPQASIPVPDRQVMCGPAAGGCDALSQKGAFN